jgi:hypothetical protein
MAPELITACPSDFSVGDWALPNLTLATVPMPQKRLGNTGVVRPAVATTKATGKPPLAPVAM